MLLVENEVFQNHIKPTCFKQVFVQIDTSLTHLRNATLLTEGHIQDAEVNISIFVTILKVKKSLACIQRDYCKMDQQNCM